MKMLIRILTIIALICASNINVVHTTSEVQSIDEDELTGPNVCKRLEEYTVEVTVTERKPYQERKTVWCANIPPRCTKYEIKFRTINKTQLLKKERVVRDCCEGYGKNLVGDRCIPVCTKGCLHGECLAPEQCKCEVGYGGPACDIKCPHNRWGKECLKKCDCNGSPCDPFDGSCRCSAGYMGDKCSEHCSEGKYGQNCLEQCQCKNNGACNFETGECTCAKGWTGSLCEERCDAGTHGENCQAKCRCQNGANCHPETGLCICTPGWTGTVCANRCVPGTYGENCSKLCECFNNGSCHHITGECVCAPGYTGNKCLDACPQNKYGLNCTETCRCKHDAECDNSSGACKCKNGWVGPDCGERMCAPHLYGENCTKTCECDEKNSEMCDPWNGHCKCKPGWSSDYCNRPCPFLTYGRRCALPCDCKNNAQCSPIDGTCLCSPGFQGKNCEETCSNGTYGQDCKFKCDCQNGAECLPETGQCICSPGWQGLKCDRPCDQKRFGTNCNETCHCFNSGACNTITGQCTCGPGWTGEKCEKKCDGRTYGQNCSMECDCDFKNTHACDAVSGKCHCKTNWGGVRCESQCPLGRYGEQCEKTCTCKNNSSCDPETGKCICSRGYTGDDCSEPCPEGYYGHNCKEKCPDLFYGNKICDHVTGMHTCKPGYIGLTCEHACPAGTYGSNCSFKCQCKNSGECHHVTGSCNCVPGFTGTNCTETCPSGFYGQNCALECKCRNGGKCRKNDGFCACAPGYLGNNCDDVCPEGFYGNHCIEACECGNNQICHPVHGCLCRSGYEGPNCDILAGARGSVQRDTNKDNHNSFPIEHQAESIPDSLIRKLISDPHNQTHNVTVTNTDQRYGKKKSKKKPPPKEEPFTFAPVCLHDNVNKCETPTPPVLVTEVTTNVQLDLNPVLNDNGVSSELNPGNTMNSTRVFNPTTAPEIIVIGNNTTDSSGLEKPDPSIGATYSSLNSKLNGTLTSTHGVIETSTVRFTDSVTLKDVRNPKFAPIDAINSTVVVSSTSGPEVINATSINALNSNTTNTHSTNSSSREKPGSSVGANNGSFRNDSPLNSEVNATDTNLNKPRTSTLAPVTTTVKFTDSVTSREFLNTKSTPVDTLNNTKHSDATTKTVETTTAPTSTTIQIFTDTTNAQRKLITSPTTFSTTSVQNEIIDRPTTPSTATNNPAIAQKTVTSTEPGVSVIIEKDSTTTRSGSNLLTTIFSILDGTYQRTDRTFERLTTISDFTTQFISTSSFILEVPGSAPISKHLVSKGETSVSNTKFTTEMSKVGRGDATTRLTEEYPVTTEMSAKTTPTSFTTVSDSNIPVTTLKSVITTPSNMLDETTKTTLGSFSTTTHSSKFEEMVPTTPTILSRITTSNNEVLTDIFHTTTSSPISTTETRKVLNEDSSHIFTVGTETTISSNFNHSIVTFRDSGEFTSQATTSSMITKKIDDYTEASSTISITNDPSYISTARPSSTQTTSLPHNDLTSTSRSEIISSTTELKNIANSTETTIYQASSPEHSLIAKTSVGTITERMTTVIPKNSSFNGDNSSESTPMPSFQGTGFGVSVLPGTRKGKERNFTNVQTINPEISLTPPEMPGSLNPSTNITGLDSHSLSTQSNYTSLDESDSSKHVTSIRESSSAFIWIAFFIILVFGAVGFLIVYYRRRVANLKAEFNHVVSYMTGDPTPGNFDNPVYQYQGGSSSSQGPRDTTVLMNGNGVIRNNLRIPPKPTNLDRYRYDGGSSMASSGAGSYNIDYNGGLSMKNFHADMTNPNIYEAVKDHVYDEIKHKEGYQADMEYDHLDYQRATSSYKPHYHRLSDTTPTKEVGPPDIPAPPVPVSQEIMLPDGMVNNISNVTDTTVLDLPSTSSSTNSSKTPSTCEPSPSLERKIADALKQCNLLDTSNSSTESSSVTKNLVEKE